ncbi:enoyl-CoA hydratase/isomerase family protein [Telmatospirillum siberiense]|uniref:Enoyl-CoA hydratase n=1 Tax=Telmatospirillum siberiense TaxID=382514 RepID=A0A2N3PQ23_9PROT|nr:enoyl-CoA hydratase/isomerase family protein [Telmatospirillum siberiense]PKU22500.1 hypothetical protein CWS72_21485 [Telmatospirillum siberiense]
MAHIQVSRRGKIGIVTINRPDARNALTLEMYHGLNGAFASLEEAPDVNAIVLTGTPPSFCAGADLGLLETLCREGEERVRVPPLTFLRPTAMRKPTVAAINGYCVGEGFALALACDIRIGGPSSKFFLPEANLGVPAVTIPSLIARSIPPNFAIELLLTGDHLDVDWGMRSGFLNHVVPDEDILARAISMAAAIAEKPPEAVQLMRYLVHASFEREIEALLEDGLSRRRDLRPRLTSPPLAQSSGAKDERCP